jgi:hypothetical protein
MRTHHIKAAEAAKIGDVAKIVADQIAASLSAIGKLHDADFARPLI